MARVCSTLSGIGYLPAAASVRAPPDTEPVDLPTWTGPASRKTHTSSRTTGRIPTRSLLPLEIGVQAIKPSPYRADRPTRRPGNLDPAAGFLACAGPSASAIGAGAVRVRCGAGDDPGDRSLAGYGYTPPEPGSTTMGWAGSGFRERVWLHPADLVIQAVGGRAANAREGNARHRAFMRWRMPLTAGRASPRC
jgi:hypothetical protein